MSKCYVGIMINNAIILILHYLKKFSLSEFLISWYKVWNWPNVPLFLKISLTQNLLFLCSFFLSKSSSSSSQSSLSIFLFPTDKNLLSRSGDHIFFFTLVSGRNYRQRQKLARLLLSRSYRAVETRL